MALNGKNLPEQADEKSSTIHQWLPMQHYGVKWEEEQVDEKSTTIQ
jgi:hypothetical protein